MESAVNDTRYYPMLVAPDGTARRLSSAEDALIWNKYRTLPQQKKDQVAANEVTDRLVQMQSKFGLRVEMVGIIAVHIRSLFFGELNLPQVEARIAGLLQQTGGDPAKAREITQFIDREILHLVPAPVVEEKDEDAWEENAPAAIARLPLLKALADYPNVGQQAVTGGRIKVKGQSEPQRPTLSNWIHYYRDELGIGFHDQVQRGRFLFQSENGKRLTGEERERLSLILKSIEEELPLDIDTGRQVIVFPPLASGAGQPAPAAPNGASMGRPAALSAPAFPSAQANTLSAPAWSIPQTPRALASQPPTVFQTPSARNLTPVPKPAAPSLVRTPSFSSSKPAANVTRETLRFSTGHVLPAERGDARPAPAAAPVPLAAPQPPVKLVGGADSIQPQSPEPARTPFSIRPVRPRRVEYKHEE